MKNVLRKGIGEMIEKYFAEMQKAIRKTEEIEKKLYEYLLSNEHDSEKFNSLMEAKLDAVAEVYEIAKTYSRYAKPFIYIESEENNHEV